MNQNKVRKPLLSTTKEFDSSAIEAQFSGLQKTKSIISTLMKDLAQNTLDEFIDEIKILVNDLNSNNKKLLTKIDTDNEVSKIYYAVHFELIELNSPNSLFDKLSIYIAIGLDLEMQKHLLGFWTKSNSESSFEFWSRVCQELKQSGIQSIHIKSLNNWYGLTQAINNVFS